MASRVQLWLDHASLAVPHLALAAEELGSRLGLKATPTPAAPDRHGRVYLDRNYIEVSAGSTEDGWTARHFFLRFKDPAALKRHLAAACLRHRFGTYIGLDGQWDDVEIDAGAVPVPILVRRTHPADIARAWPPPLRKKHRCGARTLDAVHVAVPDLAAAVDLYSRLIGTKPQLVAAIDGSARAEFRLASGRIILTEGPVPGVRAIVFETRSLSDTMRVVGPLAGAPVGWLEPALTHGLLVGFVQAV